MVEQPEVIQQAVQQGFNWGPLVTHGITALAGAVSSVAYLKRFYVPLKELKDLVVTLGEALKDGRIDENDLKNINKEWKDWKVAVKGLKLFGAKNDKSSQQNP